MKQILDSIQEKKEYKHDLLNRFVKLLEDATSSALLHQEIGAYFGVNKHELNKLHTTEDGNIVRSKSEVIICNLLHKYGIKYHYEKTLRYSDQEKPILPDFTIVLPNGDLKYWEHLGCLGMENYDQDWKHKLSVYEKYYPGKLIKTYESGVLTTNVIKKIEEIGN